MIYSVSSNTHPQVVPMPRDYDDYDDPDGFDDMDEDDRDASYYERSWGGPEDEELDDWEAEGNEEEVHSYDVLDFEPFDSPLPTPQPGDEASSRQHFVALKRKYKCAWF